MAAEGGRQVGRLADEQRLVLRGLTRLHRARRYDVNARHGLELRLPDIDTKVVTHAGAASKRYLVDLRALRHGLGHRGRCVNYRSTASRAARVCLAAATSRGANLRRRLPRGMPAFFAFLAGGTTYTAANVGWRSARMTARF